MYCKSWSRVIILWMLSAPLCPYSGLGQVRNKDGTIDCTEPTVIEVSSGKILMISSDDYKHASVTSDRIIFYKESDQYTFWYKIMVKHACEVRFDITPSEKSDFYNAYVYKFEGDNFCRGVIDKTLIPMEENLFEQVSSPKSSAGSEERYTRIETRRDDDGFYHKPIGRVINARQGEVFYMNVHHFVGEDCGHSIVFSSCGNSLTLEAKHKPCYEPEFSALPAMEAVETPTDSTIVDPVSMERITIDLEPESKPVVKTPDPVQPHSANVRKVPLKPEVFDARTGKALPVEFEIVEAETGAHVKSGPGQEGLFEAELSEGKSYLFTYFSLGYEPQQIAFESGSRKDEQALQPVYLAPKEVGSNIVLNDIYFHPNTYVFRQGAEKELERLLGFLQGNEHARIEIQGHTNGDYRVKPKSAYSHLGKAWNFRGSAKKLSKMRAEEVRDYLTRHGIESGRLSVVGYGGSQMIIPEPDNYEDRLINMRVEIVILER